MTRTRKIKLVNRVIVVVGGALILVVFAYLFAIGSDLASALTIGGVGLIFGYGLVHLLSRALRPPRTQRSRWALTGAMALVLVSSFFANAIIGTAFRPDQDAAWEIFANGFFFGTAFAAILHLFSRPPEVNGR